jgi:hypothetical protein
MSQTKLENAKKILSITLIVDIAVSALIVITNFWAVDVLKNFQVTQEIEKSTVRALEYLESFSFLVIVPVICVGLALVRWLGGCYEFAKDNLKSTGFSQEKWRISGWIIPFLNLFKPYQVINEIHKVSVAGNPEGEKWKNSSGSGMLLTWWIFWVITHLILWSMIKYSFRISFQDDLTINQAIELFHISTFACIISLVISILWLFISGGMTRRLLNRSVPVQDSVKQTRPVVTSAQKDASTPSQVENSRTNRNTIKSIPIQTSSHSDSEKPGLNITDETQVNESELYEQVWKEIEKNKTDIGLWAECFALCEGNENKTKALYINKRLSVIKKEIETQSLEAKRAEQEKIEKEKDFKLSILKGKADSIEDFSKTLKERPDFFPGILKQYGYSLIQNINRPEMWTFRLPNGTGVKNTYNIYELRTEIIKIIEEQDFIQPNSINNCEKIHCALCNVIVERDRTNNNWGIKICASCQTTIEEKNLVYNENGAIKENKLISAAMQAYRDKDFFSTKYYYLLLENNFPDSVFWSYPNGEKLKRIITEQS